MKYKLTEEQAKDALERFNIESGPGGNFTLWRFLARNKEKEMWVIRDVMMDAVYICDLSEGFDFTRCIATGNLAWWESVKQEYLDKGFTENFGEDEDDNE